MVNQGKKNFYLRSLCIVSLAGNAIFSHGNYALAQIIPDNTLGNNASKITPNVDIKGSLGERVDGGAIRGANLFHSFQEFNVGELQRVYFANPTGIENILTRVTGNQVSNILGTLGVDGAANLFFINPNGIIFGKNASLDVGKSFYATTASSIKFSEIGEFSATNPQSPSPLLTINPSAFFFNQQTNPGAIISQSRATQTLQGTPTDGLQVPNGQTLLLLGGNVTVDDGRLIARGGRVEIGAVTGTGNLGLNANGSLSFPDTIERGDVVFTNKAPANRSGIDVRFSNGGDIGVTAKNISLFSGSQLRAGIAAGLGSSASRGGDVVVNATGEIRMTGEDTRMANDVRENAIGKAGDVAVTANSLVVTNGAQLSSSTFGIGDGGNVVITADRVYFDGVREDERGVSAAFSRVESRARGNGGTVQIFTKVLEVTNGAGLFSATLGIGNGGNIIIKASDRVSFNGVSPVRKISSGAFSDVSLRRAQGKGGNLEIFTKTLEVTNGAQLSASTFGIGNAGNILIEGNSNIKIAGDSNFTGIFVASFNSGNAGDITINTPNFRLDRGVVSAESASVSGGNITLNIGDILELKNTSSISATAGNNKFGGNGGNIVINTLDGFIAAFPNENSDITANAFSGSGGKITINAKGIFGIAPLTREELVNILGTNNSEELDPGKLPTNDIVAFSQQKPDLNGEVTINTPDADPSRGLIQLPSNLVDSSQQIARGCTPKPGQTASRFISTGRGGLPLSPEQPLRGRAVITNWVALPEEKVTNREINQPPTSKTQSAEQIVEARGWIVDANSNVIFVAQSPQKSYSPPLVFCVK